MSDETILVTGSNGFIGSHLVSWFAKKDYEVIGVDRDPAAKRGPGLATASRFYRCDLPDPTLGKVLEEWKPQCLIHAAGRASVSFSVENPVLDFQDSVNLFFHVLNTVRETFSDCRVVFLSSAAVYGNPEKLPITESSSIYPISPYGFHKYICEKLAEEFYEVYGVGVSLLRIFSAYGAGLRKQVLWDICKKAMRQPIVQLFGTGEETRDFIHVDDIAFAVEGILNSASFEADVFNVANGKEVSIRELAEQLVDAIGVEKSIDFSGEVRKGDPLRWRADITRLSKTGYHQQVGFTEGVKAYADWFRDIHDW